MWWVIGFGITAGFMEARHGDMKGWRVLSLIVLWPYILGNEIAELLKERKGKGKKG